MYMSRHTGRPISRRQHIVQSIGDILETTVGTRVQRGNYGGAGLVTDQPLTPTAIALLRSRLVRAVEREEPRVEEVRFTVAAVDGGQISYLLSYRDRLDGSEVTNVAI